MAILSRTARYLFVQGGRTGCTAVARGVLIPHLDGKHFPPEHVVDARGRLVVHRKHADYATLLRSGLLTEGEAARLFKFTTVRNPWDREVSDYFARRTKLARKLEDPQWRRQSPVEAAITADALRHPFPKWIRRLYGYSGWSPIGLRRRLSRVRRRDADARRTAGMDFVMRFERLQEDFDEALRLLGVNKRFDIPRINVTEGRDDDYRGYYDDHARHIVAEAHRYEIDRFGYTF